MGIIAIGGLGGSGTRAVAQILIATGIYMGDHTKGTKDNLLFGKLFNNPLWYKRASKKQIYERLDTFRDHMEKDRKNVWGWKQPNTHVYIEEIVDYFTNLKYIHVIRHGLDMAFSSNKQQLHKWGFKYNLSLNGKETANELAYKQLEFWIRTTKHVINKGKKLGDNFLLLNHSLFCQQPKEQVDRLIQFLELELDKDKLDDLYKIPKKPASLGRFQGCNLQIFDKRQIDFVKELGFIV